LVKFGGHCLTMPSGKYRIESGECQSGEVLNCVRELGP
jgi:hypothetical protein